MKTFARSASILFILLLAGASLCADAQAYDTVTLKDGRVLKGQVVEERDAEVVMLVKGVRRSFERKFISGIVYGEGADAGQTFGPPAADENGARAGAPAAYEAGDQPEPAAAIPALPRGDLHVALSLRYRVPVGDVEWVSRQGVPDSDLSLVFLVAATARVTPRQVVKLYREGWTWDQIENYFQMQPDDIYYQPDAGIYYPYYYVDNGWDGWDGYGLGWGYGGGWGGRYGGRYGGHYGRGSYGGGHAFGGRASVGGAHAWGASAGGHGSYGAAASGGGFRASGGGNSHNSRGR